LSKLDTLARSGPGAPLFDEDDVLLLELEPLDATIPTMPPTTTTVSARAQGQVARPRPPPILRHAAFLRAFAIAAPDFGRADE
jgi:hypothetical protein